MLLTLNGKNKMSKKQFTKEYEDRSMCIHKNIHKLYLKRIASLILKKPFSTYISSEFDLNINRRMRISCAIPLLKHYYIKLDMDLVLGLEWDFHTYYFKEITVRIDSNKIK